MRQHFSTVHHVLSALSEASVQLRTLLRGFGRCGMH